MKNKTIENQMKIADEILKKLETFDPTCILAGGAPRDWYFGKVATDLDFFVHWKPKYQQWRYQAILESLGFKVSEKSGANIPDHYGRNPHLITVFEFTYKGEKVQVMFMGETTHHCVVPLFPFGICQAWYKTPYDATRGDYYNHTGVQISKNFQESVNHKVLRLLNDLYTDADGYVEKIRAKFPDYLYIGKQ